MNVPRTGEMLRPPMQQGMLGIPGGPFLGGTQAGQQQQQPSHMGMMPNNPTAPGPMGGLMMQPNALTNPDYRMQMQHAQRMAQQRAHNGQAINTPLGAGPHGLGPNQMPGVPFQNAIIQNQPRRVQSQPNGLNQAAGQFGGGLPGQQMIQGMSAINGMGLPPQMRQPMQQGPPGAPIRMPPQQSIPGGGMVSDMQMQLNRQGAINGGPSFPPNIVRTPSQNHPMPNVPQPPTLPSSHSGGIQHPFPPGMTLGGQQLHGQHQHQPHPHGHQLSSSPHQVPQGPSGALANNMAGTSGLPGAPTQPRMTPDRNMFNFPNSQVPSNMQVGVPRMTPGGVQMGYGIPNQTNPQVGGNQQMGDLAQQLGGGNIPGQQRSASRQGGGLLTTPAEVLRTLNANGSEGFSTQYMHPHNPTGSVPPRPPSQQRPSYPMGAQPPQRQLTPHQQQMGNHRSPRQPDMPHQMQMQPPAPQRQGTPVRSPQRVGMSGTPRVAPTQLPQGPHPPNRTPSLVHAQPQGAVPPPKPPTPVTPAHAQQVPIASRPQQLPPTITSQAPPPTAPPAAPGPTAQEPGPSAPPQQHLPPPAQTLPPARPAPAPPFSGTHALVGNGQSVTRLLQFSGALSKVEKNSSRLQLSHWEDLVKEYFTTRATMKLTLWKENQQFEAKPFEIGTPIIPRFFLVTAQSGVQCMSINLDGARERIGSATHGIVECVQAVWTYKYDDGWTIKLKGPMTAHILVIPNSSNQPGQPSTGTYTLKFDQIQFDAKNYERLLAIEAFVPKIPLSPPEQNTPLPEEEAHNDEEPRRMQVGEKEYWKLNNVTVPVSPINAFGIPQATMRCLELAESVTQMSDLIQFSTEKNLGPKDALKEFAKQIRQSQEGVNGPDPRMNGVPGPNPHRLHQPPPFPGAVPYEHGMNGPGLPPPVPSSSSTLLSGPPQANQGPLPPPPQQNGPPVVEGTPKLNNKAVQQQQPIASASTPSASTPSASTPSATTMTPSMAPQTLKRKAGDSSSPSITNAEQQPQGKRPRGKRRSTNAG